MYISIDIGGTNTRVASSQNLRDVLYFETFPSQQDLTMQVTLLNDAITKVARSSKIDAIVVGVAGFIDVGRGVVINSPNYQILNGVSVEQLVGQQKASKVFIVNDTNLAAFGEAIMGSGVDFKRVGYLSLGTGVGGALVVDKKPDFNISFEPGHQIINFDAENMDGLNIKGSLEAYISGTAFKKNYGVMPHECTDIKIWEEYGNNVAIAINNLIFMWDVDCVVIGGGMSKHFDKFIGSILKASFNSYDFVKLPKVLKAQFGQGSGISGGFAFLTHTLK